MSVTKPERSVVCREPIVGILIPALMIGLMVAAVMTGAWWALPICAVILVVNSSSAAQRLVVEDGIVTVSYLPFRRWSITIPLSEARFTFDAVWLTIARLDGSNITRRRRTSRLRVAQISGPSTIVQDVRRSGIHVERVPTRP